MVEIHPKQVPGPWDQGFVLDAHTVSSTMIGYNEYGHPEFDTVRSALGELVYKLKYKGDKTALPEVVETVAAFVKQWGIHPDLLVPMPPSKQRAFQPVIETATPLAAALGVSLNTTSLQKSKATPQMKDAGDFAARVALLTAAFACDKGVEGKIVLLFDDLFQSGASMQVATQVLREHGLVKAVYALALTRTRN